MEEKGSYCKDNNRMQHSTVLPPTLYCNLYGHITQRPNIWVHLQRGRKMQKADRQGSEHASIHSPFIHPCNCHLHLLSACCMPCTMPALGFDGEHQGVASSQGLLSGEQVVRERQTIQHVWLLGQPKATEQLSRFWRPEA